MLYVWHSRECAHLIMRVDRYVCVEFAMRSAYIGLKRRTQRGITASVHYINTHLNSASCGRYYSTADQCGVATGLLCRAVARIQRTFSGRTKMQFIHKVK